MNNKPIISVRNITKSYKLYSKPADRLKEVLWPWKQRHSLFHALHDVSFEVHQGEHVGIIGVNGAGKSTLLQILSGVLTPTSGTVTVNGRVAALLELGAGFNAELTGRENVLFLTSILGVDEDRSQQFLEDIIQFAEIGEFIDQPVKIYSSGMFARLAFAMNISSLPDILIVDEALAVGDAFFQQKCMRKMKDFRNEGTILFVSHDTASVIELCKNAVWLENGKVKEAGPAKKVCEHYLASSYASSFADKNTIEQAIIADVYTISNDDIMSKNIINNHLKEQLHNLSQNKISDFADKDSFGEGGAIILKCTLENLTRKSLVFTRDDVCRMSIYFSCDINISNAIIGFIFKDRLGKAIFGTNSFRYHKNWICKQNTTYAALFDFKLPDLLSGEYLVTLAIAEGTLDVHRQLHWIHDALKFQFVSKENDGTIVAAKCLQCELYGDINVE